jgi:hypothetical protein
MRWLIELRAIIGARTANISHENRCLFFHIPKTAGSSIGELGFLSYKGHYPRAKWAKLWMSSARWNDYFKFCFVRNPWDRFISLYSYYRNMTPNHKWYVGRNVEISNDVRQFADFPEFCFSFKNAKWKNHFMFDEQWTWVAKKPDELLVDFVGRFESINDDFSHICERLGLPDLKLGHANKSKHRNYREYSNQKTIDFVADVYGNDVRAFNYDF